MEFSDRGADGSCAEPASFRAHASSIEIQITGSPQRGVMRNVFSRHRGGIHHPLHGPPIIV
jgi:hypothetical protein